MRLPERCGYPPFDSDTASSTSLLIIETDPVLARSSTARTMCMHERRGKAVDGEIQVGEVAAADAELAAEIVAGCHARQHLHGPQRIVGQHAAQILELGAAEDLLSRHPAPAAESDPRSR